MLEREGRCPAGGGDLPRMDLLRQPSRVAGGRSVLLGAEREGVDLLAGQPVAIGDVLRRLDHLDVRVAREQRRVRRAAGARPHRVEHEDRTAGAERGVALHERPARARHRLDAAREADRQFIRANRVGDLDRARDRGGAEPVDRRRRNAVRETGSERRPSRDVSHSLVGRVHAARRDVLDPVQWDGDALARPDHRLPQQVVRANLRQRAAVPADRRAHATEYERVSHRSRDDSSIAERRRSASRLRRVRRLRARRWCGRGPRVPSRRPGPR